MSEIDFSKLRYEPNKERIKEIASKIVIGKGWFIENLEFSRHWINTLNKVEFQLNYTGKSPRSSFLKKLKSFLWG